MTRTRLDEIMEILGDETPQGPGDEAGVMQRQIESLYSWCRDELTGAKQKGEAARDLEAVLQHLGTMGYGYAVAGSPEVRELCDLRRSNRPRVGELRRLIAEWMHCTAKLDDPMNIIRRDEIEPRLYEHPGSSYHALLETWSDPRAQDVLRVMLRRLPRYEQLRRKA